MIETISDDADCTWTCEDEDSNNNNSEEENLRKVFAIANTLDCVVTYAPLSNRLHEKEKKKKKRTMVVVVVVVEMRIKRRRRTAHLSGKGISLY